MAREATEITRLFKSGFALESCPRLRVEPQMPARVAHDLLGIVTIIRGYSELAAVESSKKIQKQYYHRIRRACGRMEEMVEGALERGGREPGVPISKKRRVDLADLLRDCLEGQMIKARNKGMVLSLEVDTGLSSVNIDPDCLERILENLLDNAIKYSHPRSTITLAARALDDSLEIEVQDTGQGIPAAELAFLFGAYQTGSSRPTGGERSTGLGLAIVKELVEAQQGTVGVRSEVGHGSTFSVRLPLDGAVRPAGERSAHDSRAVIPPTSLELLPTPLLADG